MARETKEYRPNNVEQKGLTPVGGNQQPAPLTSAQVDRLLPPPPPQPPSSNETD